MFSRSAHRLTTTVLVVFSLLFSQLALAAYVCPPQQAAHEGEPMVMEMADGQPCEGMGMDPGKAMDQEQPVLCHQHCVNAPQSFDFVQGPTVSLPAIILVLVVPALLDTGAAEAVLTADGAQARPPPDPLFLSTLRLRV